MRLRADRYPLPAWLIDAIQKEEEEEKRRIQREESLRKGLEIPLYDPEPVAGSATPSHARSAWTYCFE